MVVVLEKQLILKMTLWNKLPTKIYRCVHRYKWPRGPLSSSVLVGGLLLILFLLTPFFFLVEVRRQNSDGLYEINNFGLNENVPVRTVRDNADLKTILYWNDAYGVRTYDIGEGREPFYTHLCPENRCVATANRSFLPNVEDFDAVLIHQRGIDWADMPAKRSPKQRYVQWVMESQQYLYMDISELDGYFNWTMSFKRNSDFYLPYALVRKVKEHPEGEALREYIREFGRKNAHLLAKDKGTVFKAAWFVSHCATRSRRERYVKMMQRTMSVDVYGKCGKFVCKREESEEQCYRNMEKDYRFYLSFENSICDDYVTEKFFNILRYNVIPVTYGGANYSAIAPPHSFVNALAFPSAGKLVEHLKVLQEDDAKYAEYFWWKDFYEVRNSLSDRAQAYCELCRRLNNPTEPPKVYTDMFRWWVQDSHCKTLKTIKWWD